MSSVESTDTPVDGSESSIPVAPPAKRSTHRSSQNCHNRNHIHAHNHSHNHNSEFDNDTDTEDDFKQVRSDIITRRNSSIGTNFNYMDISKQNLKNSKIMRLPTEVLLLIFSTMGKSDLVSLLTVCKYFADLIVELIWFRPNLQTVSTFKRIHKIMKLVPNQTYWNYKPFIRRLNLSFLTSSIDDSFLNLFIDCQNLERLTLVNCSQLTHTPISSVLRGCKRLQSVDMTGVKDIHDDIFITLAENCPRLQGVYAPGCSEVSQEAITKLIKSCPMLKRIKLSSNEKITDETVIALTENCKYLVEIDLHGCPNVTDSSLQLVFKNLKQLREFRISHNFNITDNCFDLLPFEPCLDRLRILDFTGCNAITDEFVKKFVTAAPRLRNVVLSKCLNISDVSLRILSSLGKSLHYIHLGHCNNITDYGVASLVRNCPRIQYIDLACCIQLTNNTLSELASLQRLRRIGLVKCINITDAGIIDLVQRRVTEESLERIHLSYCTHLTLFSIYKLLKACPKLTHLSLTGIQAFLRADITRFCRTAPPDFTPHQQSLFCVFSGPGVKNLRDHLEEIFQNPAGITSLNRTQLVRLFQMRQQVGMPNFALNEERLLEAIHMNLPNINLNDNFDPAEFRRLLERDVPDNLPELQNIDPNFPAFNPHIPPGMVNNDDEVDEDMEE